MSTTRTALALAITGAVLIAPAAQAHELTPKAAQSAADREGRRLAKSTQASSWKAAKCEPRTEHRALCAVQTTFKADRAVCTTEVEVAYKSHRSKRPVAKLAKTLCK